MPGALIQKLESLIHLNVDAYHAYRLAARHVTPQLVREQLRRFQREHERHVLQLSVELERLGATPPAFSVDLRGVLMEGMTALWSATGVEGALRAMRRTEQIMGRAYDDVIRSEVARHFSPTVRGVLREHDGDEAQHGRYLDDVLDTRIWQPPPVPGAAPLPAE
jgi:hypothetical protein